jgi:hypothetical protein
MSQAGLHEGTSLVFDIQVLEVWTSTRPNQITCHKTGHF